MQAADILAIPPFINVCIYNDIATSFVIFVNGMNARTNRKRNDAHRASNNTITGQNYYFYFFFLRFVWNFNFLENNAATFIIITYCFVKKRICNN